MTVEGIEDRFDREIERCLSSHGRQDSVRPFFFDDHLQNFDRERFNIRNVCGFRIGHDRSRIRVDEYDRISLVAQGLACLRAGVVELAGLTDHDRPGTDEQYFSDVVSFGHNYLTKSI